jgi:hypothetical protein
MTTMIFGVRAGLKAAVLASAAALAACAPQSTSAQEDLSWTPAPAEVPLGTGVRVAVLIEGPDGAVAIDPDAVTEVRIDMGPDGMATMAAPLRPVASGPGESLAWEADLAMAGRWALTVTAIVPGEPEPVTGEVIFTAGEGE